MRHQPWKRQRAARKVRAAPLLAFIGAATLVLAAPAPTTAQGVKGDAVTTVRYLTLRPMALDTVPIADVVTVDGVRMFDGHPVTCPPEPTQCTYYRPIGVQHAVAATQDVSGTAWGLGLQGLSATFHVRARADLGGDFTWPTSDDAFDAILAYAELQRSIYRVRLGRQRTVSGLGFSGFDGLDVLVEPWPWLSAEVYAGRSLARGLYEPRQEALQGVEPFVRDQEALLFGGVTRGDWASGSAAIRYQREIYSDRAGLLSERAALDLRSGLPGPFRLDASADYDFAFARVGKAHVTVRAPIPGDDGWLELTGRRYVPYFELWTIWGFFSPVAYHEAELRATALRWRPLVVWAGAGMRKYGDPDAPVILNPMTDTSQRYSLGARWTGGAWTAHGEYRLETGFGAFLSAGDAIVRWRAGERLALTARGTAFQQIEQFRVGNNVVVGGGVGADVALPGGLELRGGVDMYVQAYDNRPSAADWNQLRAWSMLAVPFGADPGVRR